jgi:hypothetical protein
VNTRIRNTTIGLALALAAALAPATAQAAPPTCDDMNVGVPHNASTPIFVDCTGGTGTGSPDVRIVAEPGHGTLDFAEDEVSADQWVTYTPDPGYAGDDVFTFEGITPGTDPDVSPVREVVLRVAPGTAPACANLSQSVPQNIATSLRLVCASGGDPITSFDIATQPGKATPLGVPSATGLVNYTSGATATGADSFTYRATSTCGLLGLGCQSGEATFNVMVLTPQQGPPGTNGTDGTDGANGATGPQGPQGALGPVGSTGATGTQGSAGANGAAGRDGAVITTPRLMVASFLDALTARSGKSVLLRYVSTTDARVILEVFKGSRRVAAVSGRAREGRNTIRWNGKAGSKTAGSGSYRLVLRATSGGQVARDNATVRLTGRSRKPGGGGGGTGVGGNGGGTGEG